MFGISTSEIVLILAVMLILFGPNKLPELGRSIGKALGEFKRASDEIQHVVKSNIDQAMRENRDITGSDTSLETSTPVHSDPPASAPEISVAPPEQENPQQHSSGITEPESEQEPGNKT